MTLKIVNEEFNKFLANGGWDGKGSFYTSDKTEFNGFFENLMSSISKAPLIEKVDIDFSKEINFRNIIKFSCSDKSSLEKTKLFRHSLSALKSCGFNIDASIDVTKNSSSSESRILQKWLLPVLGDFIDSTKDKPDIKKNSLEKFLINSLLPSSASYKHMSCDMYNSINFLKNKCPSIFTDEKLFDFLCAGIIKDDKPLMLYCTVVNLISDSSLKEYLKNNIYKAESLFVDKFSDFIPVSVEKVAHNNKLAVIHLLKADFLSDKLSPENCAFFKKYDLPNERLKITEVVLGKDTLWALSFKDITSLKIEKQNPYSFNCAFNGAIENITFNSGEHIKKKMMTSSSGLYISSVPNEAFSLELYPKIDENSLMKNSFDENTFTRIKNINNLLLKEYPNFSTEVEYLGIKLPSELATEDTKDVILKTFERIFENNEFFHYKFNTLSERQEVVKEIHKEFEHTRTSLLAEKLNQNMKIDTDFDVSPQHSTHTFKL